LLQVTKPIQPVAVNFVELPAQIELRAAIIVGAFGIVGAAFITAFVELEEQPFEALLAFTK
jgi:hypothetical protein